MSDSHANGNVADELSLAELLKDGLFIDGDWIESKDQDPNGEVRLIQLADIGDGVFRDRSSRFLTTAKARELRCTFLESGDILVARMPEPLGRACVFPGVNQPAVTAVDVCIIRPNPERARSEWLVNAINAPQFRSAMEEFARGTTRQRISRKNLGKLTLPVPNVDVQDAVAAAIARVEGRRGTAAQHVVTARAVVDRFRSAVLAAACSGRLTADWRVGHPGVVGAHSALELVRQENVPRRGKNSATSPDETILSELPPTWAWASVGEVGAVQLGGTPSRQRPDYWNGNVPWVSSGEVANCRIETTREFITDSGLAESNAKVYPVGTVLIAMIGEGKTRGQAAILDIEACTNQNAAGIVCDRGLVEPEYVWRWARAQYEITRAVGRGGNQPALNGQKVRELAIPVPPLEEQREIVRRTDELLATADRVAVQIDRVAITLGRVSRASLSMAFRGELVPNESAPGDQERLSYGTSDALIARAQTISRPEARRRKLNRKAQQAT